MKCLPLILLLFSSSAFSQSADFLILKKKNTPVKYIYAGSQVEFITTTGAYRNALVNSIKNDSLYLQEFLVQRALTIWGTYTLDTVGSFRYIYHYQQIKSFGSPPKKGFNIAGSGASLLGGGILLTLASGVSYLSNKDKFSPELLGAAVALGTVGYFMSRAGRNGIVIGKKYKLEYMKMSK